LGTVRSVNRIGTLEKQGFQGTIETHYTKEHQPADGTPKIAGGNIDSAETVTVAGLDSNGATDSKSGTDLPGSVDTPKFYLLADNLALELTHHADVTGSVFKTDRLYKIE